MSIRRLIFASLAFIALPIIALAAGFAQALTYLAPMLFGPAEAKLSLALDTLAALASVDTAERARQSSYSERNGKHALFVGDRFAPELCARC